MEKVWLAFANTDKFDVINCFRTLGHSNWKMGNRNFSIGDIVYFYVSSERKVMFKTKVDAINLYKDTWDDDIYWNEREKKKSKGKRRMVLLLVKEYHGEELNEERLMSHGLPEKKSPLEQPVYKKYTECIDYIRNCF